MSIVVTRSVSSADDQIQKMLNVFYPVGSYYETSDTSFDPNIAWGGTWLEDSAGRVMVAQDTGTFTTVGDTGGSEKHTHEYGFQAPNNYSLIAYEVPDAGVLSYDSSDNISINNKSSIGTATAHNFNGCNNNSFTSVTSTPLRSKGDTKYTSSLQPYVVIKRWHRIA